MGHEGADVPRYAATFAAEAAAVAGVRDQVAAVAARCGLSQEAIFDVRLAVSELVTNAIVHAYADAPGEVRVEAFRDGSELVVTVADDGPGLAPRVGSPGLGLGLPTVATVAHDLSILTPPGGGTEVRVTFRCPARTEPCGAGAH